MTDSSVAALAAKWRVLANVQLQERAGLRKSQKVVRAQKERWAMIYNECAAELEAAIGQQVGTPGPCEPSPDSIEAVKIQPLTDYEAVQAAAVFNELNRRDDPYALTRTIEHVLKMRAAARGPEATP